MSTTFIDDRDPRISYTGPWDRAITNNPEINQGTLTELSSANGSLSFSFTGAQISLCGPLLGDGSKTAFTMRVAIDGGNASMISLAAAQEEICFFQLKELNQSPHTLFVEVILAEIGASLAVDYLAVLSNSSTAIVSSTPTSFSLNSSSDQLRSRTVPSSSSSFIPAPLFGTSSPTEVMPTLISPITWNVTTSMPSSSNIPHDTITGSVHLGAANVVFIVGGAGGGVILITLIVLTLFILRRRRRRVPSADDSDSISSFTGTKYSSERGSRNILVDRRVSLWVPPREYSSSHSPAPLETGLNGVSAQQDSRCMPLSRGGADIISRKSLSDPAGRSRSTFPASHFSSSEPTDVLPSTPGLSYADGYSPFGAISWEDEALFFRRKSVPQLPGSAGGVRFAVRAPPYSRD